MAEIHGAVNESKRGMVVLIHSNTWSFRLSLTQNPMLSLFSRCWPLFLYRSECNSLLRNCMVSDTTRWIVFYHLAACCLLPLCAMLVYQDMIKMSPCPTFARQGTNARSKDRKSKLHSNPSTCGFSFSPNPFIPLHFSSSHPLLLSRVSLLHCFVVFQKTRFYTRKAFLTWQRQ